MSYVPFIGHSFHNIYYELLASEKRNGESGEPESPIAFENIADLIQTQGRTLSLISQPGPSLCAGLMKHGMDFGMERILEQNEITVVKSENHFHPLCCGGHFAIYWVRI